MGLVDYCFSCTWDLLCFVSFSFHVLLAFISHSWLLNLNKPITLSQVHTSSCVLHTQRVTRKGGGDQSVSREALQSI
jgi:hypothetical protein